MIYYSARILQMSGISNNVSTILWISAGVNAVNFLASFIGLYLVDRVGRRLLTLISYAGILVSLLMLAIGESKLLVVEERRDHTIVVRLHPGRDELPACQLELAGQPGGPQHHGLLGVQQLLRVHLGVRPGLVGHSQSDLQILTRQLSNAKKHSSRHFLPFTVSLWHKRAGVS